MGWLQLVLPPSVPIMLPAEFLCVHLGSYEAPKENDERKVILRARSTDQYSTVIIFWGILKSNEQNVCDDDEKMICGTTTRC